MATIMYIIKHKTTGQVMPQMRKNKGYTHWNPGNPDANPKMAMDGIPRLLHTVNQAKQVIRQWASMPNATWIGYTNSYGEDDYDIKTKKDGRKKEDLEIIMIELRDLGVV